MDYFIGSIFISIFESSKGILHVAHSTSQGLLSSNINNTLIRFTQLLRLDLDIYVVVVLG